MTPQKFKPGDKVGIINPNNVVGVEYLITGGYKLRPSTLDPNKEYTVFSYLCWLPAYNGWVVKLAGHTVPVAETILAPLLPDAALTELLEETLL